MKKNVLVALVMMLSFSISAFAQKPAVEVSGKPGWHKIAETTADLKSDKDEVAVVGNDHYQSIKLKVTDVPVEITDFTVYFEDGTQQDIPVKTMMKAGDETNVKDLEGKEKAIKKIVLMYKTVPNAEKDKSHVEIWGLK